MFGAQGGVIYNIYSVDFAMNVVAPCVMNGDSVEKLAHKRTRIYTNSETIDGLVDKHDPKDHHHVQLLHGSAEPSAVDVLDFCGAFIDGVVMEDTHCKGELHSDLMSMADMFNPREEQEIMESMVGIDDVSGDPVDPAQSH